MADLTAQGPRDRALARLDLLARDGVLSSSECDVARSAMLDGAPAGGRAVRASIFEALSGWRGSAFILESGPDKSRRAGRYRWGGLAMTLPTAELRARILGVSYRDARSRWDAMLQTLERLAQAREQQFMAEAVFEMARCQALARLGWFELVGELLWRPERWDGFDVRAREDGWIISEEAFQDCLREQFARTSPSNDAGEVRGEYVERATDAACDDLDRVIADGDPVRRETYGIRRRDRLSF